VGHPVVGRATFSLLPGMIAQGLAYQYECMLAWFLTWVPLVGRRLGDWLIFRQATKARAHLHKFKAPGANLSLSPANSTAAQCYPYVDYHVSFFLQLLRLR
jgi:hypothetical protein